jgi:hypothetical protein
VFKLTVAELADTGLEESAGIDRAKLRSFNRLQQYYLNVDDAIRGAEEGSPAE